MALRLSLKTWLIRIGSMIAFGASLAAAQTPAPAARAEVQLIDLPAAGNPYSPLAYRAGVFAVGGAKGTVLFSPDLRNWSQTKVASESPVHGVQHDGRRWVASTRNKEIAMSTDGKTWSPPFRSSAGEADAVLWRGKFWAVKTILGVRTQLVHGRFEQGTDEAVEEWDGTFDGYNDTWLAWKGGDRVHRLRDDGMAYSSDNAEYWETYTGYPTGYAKAAYYAEGNDLAVTLVVTDQQKSKEAKPVALRVQRGARSPDRVETSFTAVEGLAYGQGRFVALARTVDVKDLALHESEDGVTWRVVASVPGGMRGLIFGPAGFVSSTAQGKVAIYRPAPKPEKPMTPREPTAKPGFYFKDFGSRFVGAGKNRVDTGRTTPDQARVEALGAVLKRALAGEVAAKVEMAFVLLEGRYARSNPWLAEQWFRDGLAGNAPGAGRGLAELLARWKPGTPRAELARLQRHSAERGDAAAMAWLALNLEAGAPGAPAEIARWRDAAKAADPAFTARWAKRELYDAKIGAASAGDIDATLQVLPILMEGDIMPAQWTRAIELADLAVARGRYEPAAFLLDQYQRNSATTAGRQSFDRNDYVRLLEAAAKGGYKPAFAQLLDNLMAGRFGYSQDEKKAHALALELAGTGDADGMFFVGMIELQGPAVKNPQSGAEWMRKAAQAGQPQAQAWVKRQPAAP